MASELPANDTPAANRNPFRRSHVAPTLNYTIGLRCERLDGSQYSAFQRIFASHTQHQDFISEDAVVKIVQLSKLPEDELSDIWEDTLKATYSPAMLTETPITYLNKYEFFVLLAELQAKLGISDEAFSGIFLNEKYSPEPRINPFAKKAVEEHATSPIVQSTPAKTAESRLLENSTDSEEHDIPKTAEGSLSSKQSSLADGYSEYVKTFGPSIMGGTTSATSIERHVSPSLPLSKSNDEKEAMDQPPVTQKHSGLEPVSPVQSKELLSSTGTKPGEIEVAGRTNNPHRDSHQLETQLSDLALVKSVVTGLGNELQLKTIPPGIVEMEAPVSTLESDALALQRLKALRADEPQLPPRPMEKQSLSRRLLSKTKSSKSLTKSPALGATPSEDRQFSLRLLSLALRKAVTEGNIQLVSSLFKLGANVNFDCLEPPSRHHALEAAALSGQAHIVHYLTVTGADELSIGQALISALRAGDLDIAVKLVPHANMISLHPWNDHPAQMKIYVSLFGRIARDARIPPNTRTKVLEVILDHNQFLATNTAYEIRENLTVGGSNVRPKPTKPSLSHNAMQLLISLVDVVLVAKMLTKMNVSLVDRSLKNWVIPAEQWERAPEKALGILRLLIAVSAPLDQAAESEGRNAMTPLAHSVAGGCHQAVALLLEHNADPECSVYELSQNNGNSKEAFTAIGWSAKQGRLDICRQLVEAGAIPWRTGAFHRTPLYWASKNGHVEVVEYLLSLDNKRSSIDHCLVAAIEEVQPQIAKILLDNGATVTSITVGAAMKCQPEPRWRNKHLETIDILLSSKPYMITGKDIAYAIEANNFAGLSRVLEKCNTDVIDRKVQYHLAVDIQGISCVAYAKHKGALDFVSLLTHYSWLN